MQMNNGTDTNAPMQTNQANPGSSETHNIQDVEITTFEDAQMTPGFEIPMANTSDQLEKVESNHSIVEFLRRPHLMMDKSLKNAEMQPLNALVRSFNFLQKPIIAYDLPWSLAAMGGKDRKLQNFEYFRADVVIKVTINANNMTSGRFWLCYAPVDSLVDKSHQLISRCRAGVTSYPGVEMDIQVNNSVELTVPYMHWAEAMSTTAKNKEQDSMAMLYMFPITPLRSSGDYAITLQVWGWFDNITLVGPTPNTLRDSAASSDLSLGNRLAAMAIKDKANYDYIIKRIDTVMQIGGNIKKNKQPKQQEVPGPITQISSKIGAAANVLKDVPIIGEVASTVGWVSDLVSGVASIFGWSKPNNAEPVQKYISVPGYGFTHAEGQDQGLVLGLSQKNTLSLPNDSFMSGVDEMEIDYICANPGICAQAEWTTTNKIRTELIGLKVNPYSDIRGQVVEGTGKDEIFSVTSCDFVGSMFGLWRGTMCYRVAVTKTAYHSGRLEVAFVPNQDGSVANTTETTNSYRYIMDITNEAEVIIKVPFFSESYLLPVANDYGFTGRLVVRPVTALHATSTVAQTVDISVWKWMEDPVFAVPSADDVFVYNPKAVPKPRAKRETVEMQIMVANVVEDAKTITFFEGDGVDRTHVLEQTVGESVTNLRYLTRAFRFHKRHDPIKDGKGDEEILRIHLTAYDNTGSDYISFLSNIYRYARGGLNYKLMRSLRQKKLEGNSAVRSRLVYTRGLVERSPEHVTFQHLNPIHEISIPFYSKYKRVPTTPINDPASERVLVGQAYLPRVTVDIFGDSVENSKYITYRAGKDDFSFGTLVGPPQLWRPANPEPPVF
ncbi:putative structural polyprotein [Solenopsis invicta virus 13]|nr:putative structural polyprotein [Solenopsis invicta virus 13]